MQEKDDGLDHRQKNERNDNVCPARVHVTILPMIEVIFVRSNPVKAPEYDFCCICSSSITILIS
jgi:hypothetical protein